MGAHSDRSTGSTRRAELGRYGERLAARHLESVGMVVLARNWRTVEGELDIVAADLSTLVVCEVKTRRGEAFGAPEEAVDARKLARLRRLTGAWLASSPTVGHRYHAVRIDVIAVLVPRKGASQLRHLMDVG